ncbi:NEAT domain-containing protein [Weissella cibaria]|uniref:NEAT domain-containing protein n=1 Tax=Weissella cibaria TaxID=137591 RepID=UPI001CD74E7F|nr:NEAT domain-containing protein [Weissella cibaria]MCA1355423.1 NEAT domain-containing protein [Weissella cibaria]MDQ2125417.1 NEAT domain-containing protein [Weissella cibaria]MDQ2157578.1 NEAT domain-containing protein [Weissella cibaria]
MSTISRVAALFSTAALGSMLLTTSVSSVTTIVAAAETNQTQQTNALTLADGTYDTTVAVYKTGTQEDSAMMSYVESKGSMTIKNGSVTLDIAMKGQSQMDMMTGFTVAGHTATKSGTHWTVTLPVSEWAAPFATSMVIDVPAISWHEEPSADLMVTPIVPDKPADTNDTDSDAILSADVPMAASDNMDRFFNPTAKLAVKGDTTDVTLSFKDSVSNMLSMIPEVTFDGITQPLNGKNDITFNIPTKDLKPTNSKSVTLASFTSVPMSPTKGYKSDLTFDLTNVLPAKDLTTGSYKLAVSADGGMDKWFDTNFQTDLGWLTSKVTVAYQESKQGMLSMIPTVTFDNITKPVNGERFVTFEIPTKDLSPDDTNVAKIASFTSVPMSPSKGYQSNLSFDMTPALGSSSETQPEAPAQPEQPTDPETPSVPTTPETPSNPATPTTSMGVTGVGTTMPSPIANVPGTAATTTLATTPATQTTATPTTATSLPVAVAAQTPTQPNATTDKPAKSTNKAKHASNSSQSKTAKDTPATEQANTHDDKQPSSIKRAALIGAGVALTAAIGFIGTTMAVNFFKIR